MEEAIKRRVQLFEAACMLPSMGQGRRPAPSAMHDGEYPVIDLHQCTGLEISFLIVRIRRQEIVVVDRSKSEEGHRTRDGGCTAAVHTSYIDERAFHY